MGYPTKVQVIQRAASQQWYVGLPAALARALGLQKGETVEWNVHDRHNLLLQRVGPPGPPQGKKKRPRS